ncbi:unnamed protein product [Ilex paraguariensis]|uniref:Uncharacterized protein n=1 Tax=Ilex paraguariensis TaxID=185542 RepID=A0ABC8QR12_9AQUA
MGNTAAEGDHWFFATCEMACVNPGLPLLYHCHAHVLINVIFLEILYRIFVLRVVSCGFLFPSSKCFFGLAKILEMRVLVCRGSDKSAQELFYLPGFKMVLVFLLAMIIVYGML